MFSNNNSVKLLFNKLSNFQDQLLKILGYPTPVNLNYFWNFGSLALYSLVIQLLSGVFLTFWYIPSVELAFFSVEYIMREVNYGWLIRNMHANGASMFFFIVYIHISRGLYYSSYMYPREMVWYTGSVIFVLMIATAFFWLCVTFWSNELLGCDSNIKFNINSTVYWEKYFIIFMG